MMTYFIYQNDIPSDIKFHDIIAIDTETMGLKLHRDRLCLIQLSSGDGKAHLIQVSKNKLEKKDKFTNLKRILNDENLTKLFHFARFDIAVLEKNVCTIKGPIYCTKIASKLCRTFGARHGLADLCRDLLSLELDKQNQTSDWGLKELSDSQLKYAASDVLYLHKIKVKLDLILERENRKDLAESCFNFLKTRSRLDLIGFNDLDIFSH
jgi:ribonuclease D